MGAAGVPSDAALPPLAEAAPESHAKTRRGDLPGLGSAVLIRGAATAAVSSATVAVAAAVAALASVAAAVSSPVSPPASSA